MQLGGLAHPQPTLLPGGRRHARQVLWSLLRHSSYSKPICKWRWRPLATTTKGAPWPSAAPPLLWLPLYWLSIGRNSDYNTCLACRYHWTSCSLPVVLHVASLYDHCALACKGKLGVLARWAGGLGGLRGSRGSSRVHAITCVFRGSSVLGVVWTKTWKRVDLSTRIAWVETESNKKYCAEKRGSGKPRNAFARFFDRIRPRLWFRILILTKRAGPCFGVCSDSAWGSRTNFQN